MICEHTGVTSSSRNEPGREKVRELASAVD